MKIDIIKPDEIEAKSFEIISSIIEENYPDAVIAPEHESIVKRVIHTSADFEYLDSLVISPGAVSRAKEALKNGAVIVTDTNMAKAGINKTHLAKLGGEVCCYIADEDVAKEAKERGVTRAVRVGDAVALVHCDDVVSDEADDVTSHDARRGQDLDR